MRCMVIRFSISLLGYEPIRVPRSHLTDLAHGYGAKCNIKSAFYLCYFVYARKAAERTFHEPFPSSRLIAVAADGAIVGLVLCSPRLPAREQKLLRVEVVVYVRCPDGVGAVKQVL